MALVAAGYIANTDGDIYCAVRDTTFTAEASVGNGGTVSDGGESRQIANTLEATSAGGRIPFGTLDLPWDFSIVVRAYYRVPADANYHNLISKGGVFEDDSRIALGWRGDTGESFMYWRTGSTLGGGEDSGPEALTDDTLYTFIFRAQSGAQQFFAANPDIGGAGVDTITLRSSTGTTQGTNGSQTIYIGGPAAWTNAQEDGCEAGILGVLIYDHYLSDVERDAIADDGFWNEFPAGSASIAADLALMSFDINVDDFTVYVSGFTEIDFSTFSLGGGVTSAITAVISGVVEFGTEMTLAAASTLQRIGAATLEFGVNLMGSITGGDPVSTGRELVRSGAAFVGGVVRDVISRIIRRY